MCPGSPEEASAAIAEGKGQVIRPRVTGVQIWQAPAGHILDCGFHFMRRDPLKSFHQEMTWSELRFNKLTLTAGRKLPGWGETGQGKTRLGIVAASREGDDCGLNQGEGNGSGAEDGS